MIYPETDYLQLSGLQHFAFCRRQWALIHIENQWAEDVRTTEGELMHARAHDSSLRERRGNVITVRSVSISSPTLGVTGKCDVLEFHAHPKGIPLPETDGTWLPYPVEYKRGRPKENPADRLQLCAQAMCLEEMLCCDIPEGALYYGEPRRREPVPFADELRRMVRENLAEMHELYRRGHTPKVKPSKSCGACSLKSLCLPGLMKTRSASGYLAAALEESG